MYYFESLIKLDNVLIKFDLNFICYFGAFGKDIKKTGEKKNIILGKLYAARLFHLEK